MNKLKRAVSLALVASLAVSAAAGCGKKTAVTGEDNASYTYNLSIPSNAVQTLNPHDWEFNTEYDVQALTQRGLYDIIYSKD